MKKNKFFKDERKTTFVRFSRKRRERRGRSQKFKNFPRIVASLTADDLWTRLNSKILILLRALLLCASSD